MLFGACSVPALLSNTVGGWCGGGEGRTQITCPFSSSVSRSYGSRGDPEGEHAPLGFPACGAGLRRQGGQGTRLSLWGAMSVLREGEEEGSGSSVTGWRARGGD